MPKSTPKKASKIKLPGLPGSFFTWIKENPAFMDEMYRWQDANRHLFQGPTEEFPIECTISFQNLMNLVDVHLEHFLTSYGLGEEQFAAELEGFKESGNPYLKKFYSLIMQKGDFTYWANMVRKNTCLCCGGGFREWPQPAVEQPAVESYTAAGVAPAPYPAELPEGWMAHTDAATGQIFYQNLTDGTTTWEHPAAVATAAAPAVAASVPASNDLATIQAGLPAGWTAYLDEASGRVFYGYADGSVTWDPPAA